MTERESALGRVLVADDDEDLRTLIALIIREALPTLEVLTAPDGTEALEMIREGGIDGVLLDHRMPGLSGSEVVAGVRESGIALGIVLMTASSDVTEIAQRLGLDCWLAKPFGMDEVIEKVRRAIFDRDC